MGGVPDEMHTTYQLMRAGIAPSYEDYTTRMPARIWSEIVLWKEAEIERNSPSDR